MPVGKRRVPTRRHGTRKFILEALETTRNGPAIATSAIIKQVRRFAGKRIPEETIRSSLKTLVRQRIVKGRKNGNEKFYRLSAAQGGPAAGEPPRPQSQPLGVERVPLDELLAKHENEPRHEVPWMDPRTEKFRNVIVGSATLPHKLAVGEVLVLAIEPTHVETATNVHGKVVVERHPRPK